MEFVKTEEGLSQVTKPKLRVYKNIEALYEAVNNEEIEDGEIVTTEFTEGAADTAGQLNQLADVIQIIQANQTNIMELIPEEAGIENKLVDHDSIFNLVPEDTANVNMLTNTKIVDDMIRTFADVIEPIGTIKIATGAYDTGHWHICDGTDGTPNLIGRVLEQAGDEKTITTIFHDIDYENVAVKSNKWYSFTRDEISYTYNNLYLKDDKWYEKVVTPDPDDPDADPTITYNEITITGEFDSEDSSTPVVDGDYEYYATVVSKQFENYVFTEMDPYPNTDGYSLNTDKSGTSFVEDGYTCYTYATFSRPDTKVTTTTEVGSEIQPGLPNITGSFGNFNTWPAGRSVSGAFTQSVWTGRGHAGGGTDEYVRNYLDASRSSSIYGASETVQPKSYAVNFIIKVKNYKESE